MIATADVQHEPLFQVEDLWAQPLTLNPTKTAVLWDRMGQFPRLFATEQETTFESFRRIMEDRQTVLLGFHRNEEREPMGLAMIEDIIPGIEATIQVSFFDRKLKGREPLVREFVRWVFDTLRTERIATRIAGDAVWMQDFFGRVGLYFEGVKKNWFRKDGKVADLHWYGVTRPEVDEAWAKGQTMPRPRVRLIRFGEATPPRPEARYE